MGEASKLSVRQHLYGELICEHEDKMHSKEYDEISVLSRNVICYVEISYKRKRLYSTPGCMSPVACRLQHQQANIAWSQQKAGMHMVTETTQVFHTSPNK